MRKYGDMSVVSGRRDAGCLLIGLIGDIVICVARACGCCGGGINIQKVIRYFATFEKRGNTARQCGERWILPHLTTLVSVLYCVKTPPYLTDDWGEGAVWPSAGTQVPSTPKLKKKIVDDRFLRVKD
jgi:hypothetical protein